MNKEKVKHEKKKNNSIKQIYNWKEINSAFFMKVH